MWTRAVSFLGGLSDKVNGVLEEGDARTSHWFLLESVTPLIIILLAYFIFCTKVGPQFMSNRKAFQLKEILVVYNLINVIGSAWLVYELLNGGWLTNYSLKCQPVEQTNNSQAMRMARATWWYFIFKIVELLDTIFFVLRKKDNQVTNLHLYHHIVMPIGTWWLARYVPGGHGTFGLIFNTLVHILMYSYYLLAALGERYQKYLWWKKYLTMIQIIQFAFVFIHQIQLLFYECNYPKTMVLFISLNAVVFIHMFSKFFIKSYSNKHKTIKKS